MITATGIKKILYADTSVVTADITPLIAKTLIAAADTAGNIVQNVHGETWQIEETEASVTGYKNQLTGLNYRHDTVPGDITPSFTIGQYDYTSKAALMGGTVITGTASAKIGWKRSLEKVTIHKVLFCLTDDDVWFIFPNCQIVAREATTDKAIAIPVKGLVQTPTVTGVSSEYNFDADAVEAASA
jgi:hypothetical protein